MFWVDPSGSYYEGDQAHSLDAAVPQRPAAFFDWSFKLNQWTLNVARATPFYQNAVQAHLDAVAQAKGYDNIFTAVTYAVDATVPAYQADGIALAKWRAQVWSFCFTTLGQIQAGTLQPPPTPDALIAQLPPSPFPANSPPTL